MIIGGQNPNPFEHAVDAAHALQRAMQLRVIPAPHGVFGRIRCCDWFEQEIKHAAHQLDGNEKAELLLVLAKLGIKLLL